LSTRDKWNLKQESFCYLAKVIGEKGQPQFTAEEIADGFAVKWVSLEEALALMKKDEPNTYDGKFIQVRDLCFLEEAKLFQ
jgi:8-oxo-dGTP diphosphatase